MTQSVQAKFSALDPLLNERRRRRWAAVEARAIGRGGVERVAEATGLSRTTVRAALKELDQPAQDETSPGRMRRPGAGRKPLSVHDPGLLAALEKLVDPVTRGDPMGPLRWTCSSAARLAEQLRQGGHRVSERTVNRMLHEAGYSNGRPIARPWRAVSTPTATHNSGASTGVCGPFRDWASRLCRLIRRRKSWLGLSATAGVSGLARGSRRGSTFTTSLTTSLARPYPMGSMT